MDTLTITENGHTFTICADCTDAIETCTCKDDGTPYDREDVTRGRVPKPGQEPALLRDVLSSMWTPEQQRKLAEASQNKRSH